ncbi:hypothetical protein ACHAPT_002695 [Fusarium lateritium]
METLYRSDCGRDFDKLQALCQHLRDSPRHRMSDEQLLPSRSGQQLSFQPIAESLARLRAMGEVQQRQQQAFRQLAQNVYSPSHVVLQGVQAFDVNSIAVASAGSTNPSFTSFFGPGPGHVFQASLSSPTPDSRTNMPANTRLANTGPENLNPLAQILTSNGPVTTSQTLDPITTQEPMRPEAISLSTNTFSAGSPVTFPQPSQSSQTARPPIDNGSNPANRKILAPVSPAERRAKSRKILVPSSPAERRAKFLANLPVFGPPTLQEELAAMSVKMVALELELDATTKTVKGKES